MGYQTQQRMALIRVLRASGRALTAREIARLLGQQGPSPAPAVSTVYRLLGKMQQEGIVKAFLNDGAPRCMVYQMDGNRACPTHLHLKCTDCGKLIHLDEQDTSVVLEAVRRGCGFHLDAGQTTLFGCCPACGQADGKGRAR